MDDTVRHSFSELVDVAEAANRRAEKAVERAWTAEEGRVQVVRQWQDLVRAARNVADASDGGRLAAIGTLEAALAAIRDPTEAGLWLDADDLHALRAQLGESWVDRLIDPKTRLAAICQVQLDIAAYVRSFIGKYVRTEDYTVDRENLPPETPFGGECWVADVIVEDGRVDILSDYGFSWIITEHTIITEVESSG